MHRLQPLFEHISRMRCWSILHNEHPCSMFIHSIGSTLLLKYTFSAAGMAGRTSFKICLSAVSYHMRLRHCRMSFLPHQTHIVSGVQCACCWHQQPCEPFVACFLSDASWIRQADCQWNGEQSPANCCLFIRSNTGVLLSCRMLTSSSSSSWRRRKQAWEASVSE